MKIKITDPILDYENNPFVEKVTVLKSSIIDVLKRDGSKEDLLLQLGKIFQEPLTYRDVFNTALNSLAKDEIMTAQDKSKSYEITLKCFKTNEPDFTTSQVAFIINRVEKIYNLPLIIGRVKEALREIDNTDV